MKFSMNANLLLSSLSMPQSRETDSLAPISIRELSLSYDSQAVLEGLSLDIEEAKITAIVGPNGAGKTSLLKAILSLLPLRTGEVRIYGQPYNSSRQLVAYVPQRESVDWDFPISALEVVCMGRYGRLPYFKRAGKADYQASFLALEQVGLADFAERQISKLSGGQQQRVFLARALVQEARIFLLDEPFSGIDAASEQTLLGIFRDMRNRGCTVLAVHHDLPTVRAYFDNVILLNKRLIAAGKAAEVLSGKNLEQAYGGRFIIKPEL